MEIDEGRSGSGRPSRREDPAESWAPMDSALAEYRAGRRQVSLVMRTDVGGSEEVPVALFFREEASFTPVEREALALARGRVLDVGAGAGAIALVLQTRGLSVTAVEVLPTARSILAERGIADVRAEVGTLRAADRYDTILVLMNGLGLCGTLESLPAFLSSLADLLEPGGEILADSTGPEEWDDSGDGRYAGEVHMQLEFDGVAAKPFPFLFVSAPVLTRAAESIGLAVEVVVIEDGGRFLARIQRCPETSQCPIPEDR